MKAIILSIAVIFTASQHSLYANAISPSSFGTSSLQTQKSAVFGQFIAHRQHNIISLMWSVNTPEDIEGYDIERSYDGSFFEKITSLPGDGASLNRYQDQSVFGGFYYYRVKAYLSDGSIEYSDVKMVRLMRHG